MKTKGRKKSSNIIDVRETKKKGVYEFLQDSYRIASKPYSPKEYNKFKKDK